MTVLSWMNQLTRSRRTTEVLETTDKMEEEHTHLKIVDLQTCIDIPSMQTHLENEEEDYEQLPSEYHSIVIGETTTNEDLIINQQRAKWALRRMVMLILSLLVRAQLLKKCLNQFLHRQCRCYRYDKGSAG